MKNILKQFFNGDLTMERPNNQSPENKQALSTMVAIKEKLLATLNNEQKIIFEQFLEAQAELSYLEGIEECIYGFKFGMAITVEVFTER